MEELLKLDDFFGLIIVTHDDRIAALGQRIYRLEEGKLTEIGSS